MGGDLEAAAAALASFEAPEGRGARARFETPEGAVLIIDETYNANPASMAATLGVLGAIPRAQYPRRIAVLGDMLELGNAGPQYHAGLKSAIDSNDIDLVFCAGPLMAHLYAALPEHKRGGHGRLLARASACRSQSGARRGCGHGQGVPWQPHGAVGGSASNEPCKAPGRQRSRDKSLGAGYGMLYLLGVFSGQAQVFNLFRYITFRTGGAIVTAMLVVFVLGPWLIDALRARQGKGQPIREDGPQSHLLTKKGTPTMGGLMILIGLFVATILWANPYNPYVWIVLAVTLSYGLIGFYDDYLKVTKRTTSGFSGKLRLGLELLIAGLATYAMSAAGGKFGTVLTLPFFKEVVLDLGPVLFVCLGIFVIAGAGNAVNLTDGLDGLAIVPVMIAASAFGIIAYLVGNRVFSDYLQIHHVAGTGELAVICGALLGAGLGFLWFNAPPAMIFMGDTGSLALGGALGTIAVAVKHEIVLGIIGGLFVLETVSVIVQVLSFKMTGKRVFRMAPLHHHFEQKGWAEPTVVVRFWIIAVILALFGLATLKLR